MSHPKAKLHSMVYEALHDLSLASSYHEAAALTPLTDLGQCSSLLSIAVTRHHDQKQLAEERAYFSSQFTAPLLREGANVGD